MVSQAGRRASSVAAIGARLLDRVDDLASELTTVIQRAESFYRPGGVVATEDLRTSVRENLVHILSRLAGQPIPGLAAAKDTGRRRADQGVPLPPILRAYRVAGKFIWEAVLAEASGDDVSTRDVVRAGSELWLIIDEHSGAVTDAYRDTVAENARTSLQTRTAMLEVLFRGDVGGTRLWECASVLRLPQHGTFVVVAARAPGPGVEAIPRVEDALRVRGIQSAWRLEVDAQVGVVVTTPNTIDRLCECLAELATGRIGLSETYSNLDQTPTALRQAHLASLGAAPRDREIVRYERAPIAILLASAPEAAEAVARSILGPVLALPTAERDVHLATLRAWFAENGVTSAVADKLHVHRNTVRYRLRRIEELTGRSLSQPTGTAELHLALEATRFLRPPGA